MIDNASQSMNHGRIVPISPQRSSITLKYMTLCLLSFLTIGRFLHTSNIVSIGRLTDDNDIGVRRTDGERTPMKETKNKQHFNRTEIRRWGCLSRNETPFIFVHIGKAGGGEIRRMFAAAARNYTKNNNRSSRFAQKTAYYSIHPNNNSSKIAIGRFANSAHNNFRPEAAFIPNGSLERNKQCDAETPIGQATVCRPLRRSRCPEDDGDPTSSSCHLVYVGHNMIGNEMHWLPTGYLERWWNSTVAKRANTIPSWGNIPTCGKRDEECRTKLTSKVDSLARQFVSSAYYWQDETENKVEKIVPSWAPIYASLPVLRVTMTREPFSWLASKYLWHSLQIETESRKKLAHDDIEEMTMRSDDGFAKSLMKEHGPGWANHFALKQIMMFCGEDCVVRYIHGSATLEDIERQAEENLRHSFAVVGLLTETQAFYDMVSARVTYMVNLTQNAHLAGEGGKHSTSKSHEVKESYADLSFQKRLINASPEIRTLVRLYKVSVEVNRFQKEEYIRCSTFKSEQI